MIFQLDVFYLAFACSNAPGSFRHHLLSFGNFDYYFVMIIFNVNVNVNVNVNAILIILYIFICAGCPPGSRNTPPSRVRNREGMGGGGMPGVATSGGFCWAR